MASAASFARSATCCATSSSRCAECGFDAFALRADRDAAAALAGFDDFAGVYAATSRTPQPWFRRRARRHRRGRPHASALAPRVADGCWTLLRAIATQHAPAVFASSFGAEDMVLIDLIARHALPIRHLHARHRAPARRDACADRPHAQALRLADRHLRAGYARACRRSSRENGVNAFYDSVELRKACCAVRKTEPLQRALAAQGRVDHRPAPRAVGHARASVAARGIRRRARHCRSSIRWPTGATTMSGRTCAATTSRTTRSHDRGYPSHRLRAVHARHRSRARTCAPAAGGGKHRSTRNAGCIRAATAVSRSAPRRRPRPRERAT